MRPRNNLLLLVAGLLILAGAIFYYEVEREATYAQGFWTDDWSAYAAAYGPPIDEVGNSYDYKGTRPIWPTLIGLGPISPASF